jgi:hypothetical protein
LSTTTVPLNRRLTAPRARERTFTRDEIVAAIGQWHERYGEAPRMVDWEPSRARRYGQAWRAERFEAERWPSARVVRGHFGTFNAAIEAAGLVPRAAARRSDPTRRGSDAIVYAFIDWTRRYGDVPTMADWDPARARQLRQEWRIARYYDGDWPSARSVATHFGSFANAAESAGLTARSQGVRPEARENRRSAARAVASTLTDRVGESDFLAGRVRDVARANASNDPVAIHAALVDLAGAALAWAEVIVGE